MDITNFLDKQNLILNLKHSQAHYYPKAKVLSPNKIQVKGLFQKGAFTYYIPTTHRNSGYCISPDAIESIEVLQTKEKDKNFNSFEDFKSEFDTKYISESLIKELWDGHSSQHGGKYNRNDFRYLSGKGKRVAERFSNTFTGIGGEPTPAYHDGNSFLYHGQEYKVLRVSESADGKQGRDISISYQTNIPDRVFYSSEFPGCGNGQYFFLIGRHKVLHIEND